jgi:phosphate transport system permease protein
MSRDHKSIYKRNLTTDRWAGRLIQLVGMGTLLCILTIILVILFECLPLFIGAKFEDKSKINLEKEFSNKVIFTGLDNYLDNTYVLNNAGYLSFYKIESSELINRVKLDESKKEGSTIESIKAVKSNEFVCVWNDNSVARYEVKFFPVYEKGKERRIDYKILKKGNFSVPKLSPKSCVFGDNQDGRMIYVLLDSSKNIVLKIDEVEEDFLGNKEVSTQIHTIKNEYSITQITMDSVGRYLYALSEDNYLYKFNTANRKMVERMRIRPSATTMAIVQGDLEVAIAFDDGSVEIYAPALIDGVRILKLIHEMSVSSNPILTLYSSPRNRTLFAIDDKGILHAVYTTNEKKLTRLPSKESIVNMQTDSRGKYLSTLSTEGSLQIYELNSDHPEVNVKALFGKIWYAGYQSPEYAWQSSSGSDDFEPKLSLIPLVFGSIKASFYAMLFSIPISVLAALYVSQFAGDRVKKIVKPVVEIMSAIPSVVIGFIAALVLAPFLDSHLCSFMLLIVLCPFFLLLIQFISNINNIENKFYKIPQVLVLLSFLLYLSIAFLISDSVEIMFFSGDFRGFFINTLLDGNYDMRNSIIIAFSLGFAVIPIVFSMSEDALTSVPKGLTTASLALGANRWETAWRIVLPAASPGIFAAIVLGFGRAIGETMIVLMATGNTPIIDGSIFSGLRALSANIAVEIPEAPQGGTLYRVLFLSAGLLLVFTSFLNTASELIRQRLRKTYSKF